MSETVVETSLKRNHSIATWIVMFLPCGHVAEYGPNHPRVYLALRNRGDLVRGSDECPICNPDVLRQLFVHICEP